MQVKICGITQVEDAAAAAAFGADFVGLVMAAGARRVGVETARQIVQALPQSTSAVLLFRDAPIDEVVRHVARAGAPVVQLHGREDAVYVSELSRVLPQIRIIKAWELHTADESAPLSDFLDAVAAAGVELYRIILDAPKSGAAPDRNWFERTARARAGARPGFWRAGGLSPDSLRSAIGEASYAGVDVSRGVEAGPGLKDHALMKRFIETAKGLPARQ